MREARVRPDFALPRACRTRGLFEQTLESGSPGEHRPRDRSLARVAIAARTDSRGEKSFEAGVPAAESGEPGRSETRRRTRTRLRARDARRLATPGNRRHGLPVRRASGLVVARGRRAGERGRETLGPCRAVGRSNANPQGSRRPARAGTAPREGKALKGDSRDASGMKQGREASGRHGERRAPQGVRACRERSQNRREGSNPEDGTGGGLATSTHPAAGERPR